MEWLWKTLVAERDRLCRHFRVSTDRRQAQLIADFSCRGDGCEKRPPGRLDDRTYLRAGPRHDLQAADPRGQKPVEDDKTRIDALDSQTADRAVGKVVDPV